MCAVNGDVWAGCDLAYLLRWRFISFGLPFCFSNPVVVGSLRRIGKNGSGCLQSKAHTG